MSKRKIIRIYAFVIHILRCFSLRGGTAPSNKGTLPSLEMEWTRGIKLEVDFRVLAGRCYDCPIRLQISRYSSSRTVSKV